MHRPIPSPPARPGARRGVGRWAIAATAAVLLAAGGVAAPAQAATKHVVRLSITSITHASPAVAGSAVTVAGTASSNLVGRSVLLQRYVKGAWRSTGRSVKVPKKLAFTISSTAAGLGSVRYRLHTGSTAKLKAGTSSAKSLLTYQWLYLDSLTAVTSSRNWDKDDGVQVASVFRKKNVASFFSAAAFGGWTSGYAEYNLSNRCTTFQATAGVNDTAGSKSQWDFTSLIDGAETDLGSVGLNKPIAVNQDVTGGFRLRLENTRVDGKPYQDYESDAIWADAKILCSGTP